MIDHLDKKTAPLPLEEKRGRGRPKTGKALTPAQKQKAYRERQKGNVTTNAVQHLDENMELREKLLAALEEIEGLKSKLQAEFQLGEKARKQVIELKKKEASNVTENEIAGPWLIQKRGKNARKWTTIGEPEPRLQVAKASVEYMQNESATGQEWTWRAVNEEGLTYTAKAAR